MNHWQRTFAYLTGALVIGLMIIVFTNGFLNYVNDEGSSGYIALLAYGFVFLNLSYGLNRRFSLKAENIPLINYSLALLTVLPTLFWIYTKDEGMGSSITLFSITILFAVLLGTYYGTKKGSEKRAGYLKKAEEELYDSTPEELKRPHDNLKKN